MRNRDSSCNFGFTAKICTEEGADDLDGTFPRITSVMPYHSVYVYAGD
jgi:hypothetical protein